jgi:hypothetical protein
MSALGIGLFSGGLDSILAQLVLRRQGARVRALTFSSPFFSPDQAQAAARIHDLELTVDPLGPDYLDMVKDPPRGRGSNMNPCIDCHAFMLRRALELMEQWGADFVFTGEVLGQRPMSQNKQALGLVAKLSGRPDLILRPLSARLLPPTKMEEEGLVDRERLLDLKGRGRKPQMALARELGVRDYPAPAGGCLLTEPGFSNRLRDLFAHTPEAGPELIELLKWGRHLRLSPQAKLVVGRKHEENLALERLAPPQALCLRAVGRPGPLGLYFGPAPDPEPGPELTQAIGLVAGYGKAKPGETVEVELGDGRILAVEALSRRLAEPLLL